ncbi:MAG: hypothetical protein WB646_17255 [Steroidobacteraceae bacterium]
MGSRRWCVRQFAGSSLRALAMNLGGMLFHGFFNLVYGVWLTDPTTPVSRKRAAIVAA